jgi:hypothetical protein
MKKDIDFSPVTGVKLAIAKSENSNGIEWNVYIINLNLIQRLWHPGWGKATDFHPSTHDRRIGCAVHRQSRTN